MENSNNHPLPLPTNGCANKCMKIKPPVPLPRKNVNINNSVFKDQSSSTSSNLKDLKNNQTKREIKMASENVLERKKSVVENTRSMSIYIEKSLRSLLPRPAKRHTTSQTSEDINLEINELPIENDIFSSLSFDSPIPSDSNSDRSFTNYYAEYDSYSPKPPNFPPPPLPEDVLYDKIPSSSNSSSQCGSYSTENMYEFISNGHAKPNTNSSYENWNLPNERSNSWSYPTNTSSINSEINCQKSNNFKSMDQTCFLNNEDASDESKSVVVQFDPLHNPFSNLLQKEKEEENCSLLQEIDEVLCTSYYSTIESTSDVNDNLENYNEDLYAIPEPPDRVDSIQESSDSIDSRKEETNELDFKEETEVNNHVEEKPRRNSLNSWSNMKHNLKKVAVGSTGSIKKIRSILKAEEKTVKGNAEEHSSIFHDGILFVSTDEKNKDFEKKMCKIAGGLLKYSNTKTQMENSIPLTSLLSIQTVDEPKKSGGEDVFCFKVNFISRPQYFLFGALCTTERLIWMQKFLGSVTSVFPFKLFSEFSKAGFSTLKEGINGEWKPAWLLLHNRELAFAKQTSGLESIDLRKVRNVVTREDKEMETTVLVIDCITKTIYLKFDEDSEISNWHHLIKAETVNASPHLKDQQLSMDQVPVIVEKCIKFIYAHGCLSEGVYRRNGSCVNATKLLSAFSKDAWAVQLSLQEYSVNDVACVLKRFFRNLPESLFTTELHIHLCNAAKCNCPENEKVILYRSLLERLPDINYVTVRKLLNHLYYIQLQSDENLMNVQNLAAIWGPTLMHIENNDTPNNWSKIESEVIKDLILLYPKLFDVKDDEFKREDRFLEAIKDFNLSSGNAPQPSKPSGDLLFWIYLGSKYSENCVSVTLSPSKTALMVCDELASKMGASRGYSLGLQEVICNGTMFRPIHHSEFLLDIVLLWGYWDEKYRKDNYIVCLLPNSLLSKIMPFANGTLTICGELKFADIKSKSYKLHLFEINEGKLICYKDKSGSVILHEWFVKDIIWYIGFESNRNPHTRWCITFTSKNSNHTKEPKDHFGWSIAGITSEDHLRWMAALLSAEYGVDNIVPPVTINLLDY